MSPLTPTSLASSHVPALRIYGDDKKSSPAYLCLKRSIYYFRYALPKEPRLYWGRSELRLSLRTSYLRAARFRARMLLAEVEKMFIEENMLEYREIRRRMNILLQRMLAQDHADLSEKKALTVGDITVPYDQLRASQAEMLLRWNSEKSLEKLAPDCLIDLFRSGAFTREELSAENYLQIVKAYNEMQITMHRIEVARLRGDFLLEEEIVGRDFGKLPCEIKETAEKEPSSVSIQAPIEAMPPKKNALLYSEAMERYTHQKLQDGEWREHSVADHRGRLGEFLAIIGDKPIESITREDMRHFRETLRRLPPNRTRVKAYKDKSIQELLALKVEKTLSVTTVNILVEAVGSLLGWYVREGVLESNPATHLQIKDTRQAIELRQAFSADELSKIFAHPKFARKEFKSPSYYWIPLIALYTGMRLEEIAQLHCADIYESQTKGIWVIDINSNGLDELGRPKLLKNKNARRIVPIHPVLITLGILDYHADIVKKKHIRLFPDLKKSEGAVKFGKQPGKQFKSVVTAVLGDAPGKTFHSLRHTFADFYKQRGLQNDYFRQAFGHELPMLAAKQYGEKFSPETLYENVIVKLDYGKSTEILLLQKNRE